MLTICCCGIAETCRTGALRSGCYSMMNQLPQNNRKIYNLDKTTLHEVARVGRKLPGKLEGHKARFENLNLSLTASMAVVHASTLCPRNRGFLQKVSVHVTSAASGLLLVSAWAFYSPHGVVTFMNATGVIVRWSAKVSRGF